MMTIAEPSFPVRIGMFRAQVQTTGGMFQVRDDEREAWVGAGPHKTP